MYTYEFKNYVIIIYFNGVYQEEYIFPDFITMMAFALTQCEYLEYYDSGKNYNDYDSGIKWTFDNSLYHDSLINRIYFWIRGIPYFRKGGYLKPLTKL